jgi:hypothetical protein
VELFVSVLVELSVSAGSVLRSLAAARKRKGERGLCLFAGGLLDGDFVFRPDGDFGEFGSRDTDALETFSHDAVGGGEESDEEIEGCDA